MLRVGSAPLHGSTGARELVLRVVLKPLVVRWRGTAQESAAAAFLKQSHTVGVCVLSSVRPTGLPHIKCRVEERQRRSRQNSLQDLTLLRLRLAQSATHLRDMFPRCSTTPEPFASARPRMPTFRNISLRRRACRLGRLTSLSVSLATCGFSLMQQSTACAVGAVCGLADSKCMFDPYVQDRI
jgi:hypothetical protein